jgi:hypothetical protein
MGRKLGRGSRVKSPYVRQRSSLASSSASESKAGTGRLASLAGQARPTIEQLERRQMLFALSVTADDVANSSNPSLGIGTHKAFFGYVIPYLNTSVVVQPPQPPTTITETFSDEPYGPVGSGQFFLASGIQTRNNITPPTNYAISSATLNAQDQNRWLFVNQNQAGAFFTFEFFQPANAPTTPVYASSASVTIAADLTNDNTGLFTDNVRVDLLAGANRTVIASFTGAALRALIQPGGNPALGTGTFLFTPPATSPGFTAIQFTMLTPPGGGANTRFRVTDISYTIPSGRFAPLIEGRIFGAEAVISGPVGATATFTDLYGRDLQNTIALGTPSGSPVTFVDPDDNGVPNFNDGIGAIHFTGTDSRTAFTLWGGTIQASTTQPPNSDFFDQANGFAFTVADPTGLYDAFQSAGFAFAYNTNNGQVNLTGLPPGPGSVIIGSPYVRPQNNYNPTGPAASNPVTTGFTNASQGLFIDDGQPISSVYIHGILNGSSRFTNFVDRIYVGYLLGSIDVEGDLGSLVVGTDAGEWSPDPGFTNPNVRLDNINKTDSQLVVGRTIGEIDIAGRSLVDVTVIGDLNDPTTRPARDVFDYYEKEFIAGINTAQTPLDVVRAVLNNTNYVTRQPSDLFRSVDQGMVFGPSYYRNDTIMGAEWVGSISSGVRIKGDLSGRDPSNAEDTDDVYAFAVDGTQQVSIEGTNNAGKGQYFRIVDQDGRTIAAPQATGLSGNFQATTLNFKPNNGPGVYYLVVTDPNGAAENNFTNTEYTIVITGMATATLGAYRTGGGSGFTDINTGQGNSVTVLAGNIGTLRIGTGLSDGAGGEIAPIGTYNTVQSADDSMSFQGGTFSTPGNLYNITTGSDIGNPGTIGGGSPINIHVGGDFGTLVTGLSQVLATTPGQQGDLNFFSLNVGGRIASLDVRGGIGMDQDSTDPRAPLGNDQISIVSGAAGGNGNIGFIRVGFHVAGGQLSIHMSPQSILGAFLVSQDAYNDTDPRSGIYLQSQNVPIGTPSVSIFSGAGSDVRFVDTPRIDLPNSNDVITPLIGGQVANFVDDDGSRVRISVEGGADGTQLGTVRVIPINGSQGVAIGQISVNLTGGAILHISGSAGASGGVVSIGHIVITNGDPAAQIQIDGNVKVDVYRIDAAGGQNAASALDSISNTTPGGDIVAIDAASLNTLTVKGDLGRTQVPSWGPQLIGPQLGLAVGLQGTVGAPLGLPLTAGTTVDNDFARAIFRPVTDEDTAARTASLDDIGSPIDGQLNGLVVRSGSVTSVSVDGAMGDVILQDATGTLTQATANADHVTALGHFDGVIGNIFAANIGSVDIGDGLAASDGGPMATTGIVASNDISSVSSSRSSGAIISGNINALNSTNDAATNPELFDGLANLTLRNGQVIDARLASEFLDGFWRSFNYDDVDDPTGNIGNIELTNTSMFRTAVTGQALSGLKLTGANGFFDASTVRMTGAIDTISATGYRNSTLAGQTSELHNNFISGARDVNKITTPGDMQDLTIDITGNVTGSITAVNFTRDSINVDGELKSLSASNDVRASTIVAGAIPTLTAGRNIQSSSITVSGPLNTVTAGDHIANTTIAVTGPDGRIDNITAPNLISGAISASGPIGTISVTAGDLAASITTTTSQGTVGTLSASRDLDISTDISAGINSLVAGRNIGSPTNTQVILVRGNLGTLSATNGQLYSDLRAGGTIGTVTIGGAVNKPGNDQIGHGSIISFSRINSVVANGDFDGDIISYTGGINSVTINNGSFLPGHTIAAYDGSLNSVVINNGSLFGNVHADYNIQLLKIVGAADGVFGDIGINPSSNGQVSYDSKRNQLPDGVMATAAIDGPTISAGQNIVSIQVTNGSVFESTFFAGRAINSITISGRTANDNFTHGNSTVFAAGDSIDSITISGGANNTAFISGLVSFGSDGRPGGVGDAADTVKSGNIKLVTISGGVHDSTFSAGINPGADGVYNTADDLQVFGLSRIEKLALSGSVTNTSAFADQLSSSVAGDNRLIRGGTNLPVTPVPTFPGEPPSNDNKTIDNNVYQVFSGTKTFKNINGADITVAFSGPGTVSFDPGTNRIVLTNTNSSSNLTISSSTGTINNFDVISNDDASMGTIKFQTAVTGDSDLIIDGNVGTLSYGDYSGTGVIAMGGDVGSATFASLPSGYFSARTVQTLKINGQFGNSNSAVQNEARIDLLSGGSINITGSSGAVISVDRDLNSLAINGQVDRSAFRFGNSISTFNAPNFSRSFLSAGDTIGTVNIGGDMSQSTISAGADLGADAIPGGTGTSADTVSTGFINSINIAGGIPQSSITAGYLRGADGFFGTSDDSVAAGRSSIGNITVAGTQVGSSRNSESYRIASSGTLGTIRIGGQNFTGTVNNFATEAPLLAPVSIQVSDIQVDVVSRVSVAHIIFNQPMDASTISAALSVSEVRSGDVTIRLVEGIDYTVSYDATTNAALVQFSTAVTEQNLPQVPGKPGPGIYRFELDQNIVRAKLTGVRLDGNGDGFATPGDNFSGNSIVGDAGDKVTAETDFIGPDNSVRVDMYPPIDLDTVMDNNFHPDGLPDPNKPFTVRGFIGDHPDNDTNFFRFSGDVDLYKITLQAGQILHLGALQGSAILAGLKLFDPNGAQIQPSGTSTSVVVLPSTAPGANDQTFPTDYLIKVTGTYLISVGDAEDINTPGVVPNPPPPPGGLGDYSFVVNIFDDGNSGFNSGTEAGSGTDVVNAPTPISFAGADGVFGTPDDLPQIVVGNFTFTLNRGPDGKPNTADDLVSGTDNAGITSTRDGTGREVSTINSSIGPAGHNGAPVDIASDVDIYNLNGHNPIAPGTKMTITVKLTDLGADLGSATAGGENNRGSSQFGIFDTSNSSAIDDGNLVFSPTDFSPNGGKPNTLIADNGATRYGYDQNGDFFITFIVPDRQGAPGASGTFAVYIQGTNNTDYQLQIVTDPTNTVTLPTQRQNILIETNGGNINWLQAGGLTTTLGAFDASTLGFTGNVNGQNVQTYILNHLVAALNGLFQSASTSGSGFDVHFSTNPSDFEFQPFSTVFLTSSADPVAPLFDPFSAFNAGRLTNQFVNTQPYGYSQHSDPFNTNIEDEAVVFVPTFALQGLTPGATDVDNFVQSLTAAVGRRAGELMGLRISQNNAASATSFDPFAANSVDNRPGTGRAYSIDNTSRGLSDPFDQVTRTDFFLGHQNARSLLEKVLQQL